MSYSYKKMRGDCFASTFDDDIHVEVETIKNVHQHDTYYLSRNQYITHMHLKMGDQDDWSWEDLSEMIPIEIQILFPEYPWDQDSRAFNENQCPDIVKPALTMLDLRVQKRYNPETVPQQYIIQNTSFWERKYKGSNIQEKKNLKF